MLSVYSKQNINGNVVFWEQKDSDKIEQTTHICVESLFADLDESYAGNHVTN